MKLFVVLSLCIIECLSVDYLQVSVDNQGAYNLSINDQIWLRSSHTAIYVDDRWYSSDVNTLKFENLSYAQGTDIYLGAWNETQLNYDLFHNGTHRKIIGSIRQWISISAITFHLNTGELPMESTVPLEMYRVRTVFPGFLMEQFDENDNRGYFTFHGIMTGDGGMHAGHWNSRSEVVRSSFEMGPLVLFNLTQRGEQDVLILSPFSQFMATSFYQTNSFFEYGIMGSMSPVPSNYNQSMIVFYSSDGINEGIRQWGQAMQRAYNRTTEHRLNDMTINYLGYYTDAGGFYWYHTEEEKNYEETIVDVYNTSPLPIHYIQLDSWWYYQGIEGGVANWTARSDVFPDGIEGVRRRIENLPFVVHNRYWALNNIYIQNYSFILDSNNKRALPASNDSFWFDLLNHARQNWGIVVYEQDWLDLQTTSFTPLHTDIQLGHQWLKSMGDAADKLELNIQYCMSLPRHILHALETPRITQTRVSFDYTYQIKGQDPTWAIGIPSMFADAIGLAPFKDVFWSSSLQPNSSYHPNPQEILPDRAVLISTLSTGPVAPGDRVHYTDVNVVMKCCRQDGLILKPDRPLTTLNALIVDWALSNSTTQGELYSTQTTITNQTFHILFASAMKKDYIIYPSTIRSQPGIVWFYENASLTSSFNETNPIHVQSTECHNTSNCLWYISSLQSLSDTDETQYALLGELNKWTAVSRQRFLSIETDIINHQARITIEGVAKEIVSIAIYHSKLQTVIVNCSCSLQTNQTDILITSSNVICI